MVHGALAWSLATTLVAQPLSLAPRALVEEPQPGWDDPVQEAAAGEPTESPPPQTQVPPEGVTPPPKDVAAAEASKLPERDMSSKPKYRRGTGLIIGAAITGGLGWALAFARMGLAKRCADAIADVDDIDTGLGAGTICFRNAGIANLILLPVQYTSNVATWGLAPAAGIVRGRYDGVEHAWTGIPDRAAGAFIGVGVSVLVVGVVGRVVSAVMVGRPFRHLASENPDIDAFSRDYRLRLLGVQLSSASIALGAGLLAYGASFRKHDREQARFLQQVRVRPDVHLNPRTGLGYAGLSLTGRF